jgi:hypothetical protein
MSPELPTRACPRQSRIPGALPTGRQYDAALRLPIVARASRPCLQSGWARASRPCRTFFIHCWDSRATF